MNYLKYFLVVLALVHVGTARVNEYQESATSRAKEDVDNHDGFEQKILLGEMETQEYHELSEDEKAARLRILAENIDKDKNGTITEDELKSWTKRNHVAYIVRRSREFFENTDENNDGFVTFDEYEKIKYKTARVPKNYQNTTRYRHEKRRFQFADRDNSGNLTLKEFVYFLYPEEGKHMIECIVEESIENMDRDDDGLISIKDYMGEGVLEMTNEKQFLDAVEAFKELDTNADGVLDKEEMTKWISPDQKTTAAAEATHMIKHGDKDKDGQLSYEEVVSMGQLLETSRATQYGEILQRIKPAKQEL